MVEFQDIAYKLIILVMLTRTSLQDCYRIKISRENCNLKLKFNPNACNWNYDHPELECTNLDFTLSNKDLDYVGNDQERIIEILDSEISFELTSGLFRAFTSAMYIGIHGNNITVIEPGTFNSLPNLMTLNISGNYIKSLPDGVFNSLYDLLALDLSGNQIEFVKDTSLLGMHDLKELYLHDNRLCDMSAALGSCESLTRLDLSGNNISTLSAIDKCINLKYLDISKNYIRNFTKAKFEGTSLIHFDISHNELDHVENDNLKNLFTLEVLNLSGNPLFASSGLPVDLFQSTKYLKRLNLSCTALNRIRVGTFSRLLQLEVLDLSGNTLTDLPRGLFQDLTSLRKLYINNNRLSSFRFDYFATLQVVNLNYNHWNCDTLSSIMKYRKNAVVIRGNTYNDTNVYGIACGEGANGKEYNVANSSLQEEYLSNITIIQGDIKKAIIEFKSVLDQINNSRTNQPIKTWNEDVLVPLEKLLNESIQTRGYYQETFQKQRLDLQEIWSKIMNATNILNSRKSVVDYSNNDTYTSIKNRILADVKDPLEDFGEKFEKYAENVHKNIEEILMDIKNSLVKQEDQTQPLLKNSSDVVQSQVNSYAAVTGRNSDTVALYCIFVVLLLILAIFVTVFVVNYRKYNRYVKSNEESNPLNSILL